ncbi:MAG: tRNA (adenosine(37)-N6)-threonylcarbamoyltransferase complex ATPase subunit type 1 TsaE [Alphaproteobacteria bacterium]
MSITIDLDGEDATADLAATLSRLARGGDVLALDGDLGSGKTAFARAFIRARCGSETEVPSPTFTLLQEYDDGQMPIHHFDLYRLEKPDEALELGIDDAFADGISLIEWPARLGPLLPSGCLTLTFSHGDGPDRRRVEINGWDDRLADLS